MSVTSKIVWLPEETRGKEFILLPTMLTLFTGALMITGFVGMMMLLVEYINVLTIGRWRQTIARCLKVPH